MASQTSSIPDRRAHPRLHANVAIRYGTAAKLSAGELVDVSAGGIGITGEKAYPQGTELEVHFRGRNSQGDLLCLRAVVRHCGQGNRMGLEFVNLPVSDFSRTLAMIERLTAAQTK